MNPRSTVLLAAVGLALGVFIWFYEIEGEAGRKKAEEADAQVFAALEPGDIDWIELRTTDDVDVRVERSDGRWRLRKPLDFPADTVALDGMAGALADLAQEQAIEAGQPLSVYGLAADARRIAFGTAGGDFALRIGNKAPLGSNTYVARGSDDSVSTVPTWRINALSEEWLELRDRRVLAFDQQAVQRIEASWPEGRVVVERAGEEWQIREPLDTPADRGLIEDLLSDLSYLRSDGFVDEEISAADARLDPPDFSVVLELASSGAEDEPAAPRLVRFELGRARGDGQRLARGSHDTLYALGNERIDEFPRELVLYRDRVLTAFVPSEADALEFVFNREAGEQTGASRVRVEAVRDATGWTSDPPLQQGRGADLVTTLSNLRAEEIVAEAVGADELAGLGLAPPRARIAVLGKPSGEGTDRPVLGELLLGRNDRVKGLLAMRPDRLEVFRLTPKQAERLPFNHDTFEREFIAPAAEAAPAPVDPGDSAGEAPAGS